MAQQPSNGSDIDLKPASTQDRSLLLSKDRLAIRSGKVITGPPMIAPLVIHLLGSVAIAVTLNRILDGRHFYLSRQPRVKLADGSYQSGQLGRNNILQSDVTTMVSVALVVLRLVMAAWAGPLCWRVIFMLAGRNGLRRRDIRWVASYGVLPPATHFRHPRNLLLGLVLIFTLAPYPGSPILTGSISWVPSSSTIELSSHPIMNITGPAAPRARIEDGSVPLGPTFSTDLVINFNTAWTQDADNRVFKRVIPAAAELNVNSTVDSVLLPYFAVTKIEWISNTTAPELIYQNMESLKANSRYSRFFQPFVEQLGQPGAAGLVMDIAELISPSDPPTLALILNVKTRGLAYAEGCDSTNTFLPNDTTVPSFRLNRLFSGSRLFLNGCFAYANVTYFAGFGSCRGCQVGSYSTVQNVTELEEIKPSGSSEYAVELMLENLSSLTPVKSSLPNPSDSIETYLTAVLIRSYSALWNTWNDGYGYNLIEVHPNSTYKPAFSTLRADVDQKRVAAWLALQLSVTVAGLVFIWLQMRSEHLVITDTDMVAFDIDSTEATKPESSGAHEPREMLRFETKGDGWKVVIDSGHIRRDFD